MFLRAGWTYLMVLSQQVNSWQEFFYLSSAVYLRSICIKSIHADPRSHESWHPLKIMAHSYLSFHLFCTANVKIIWIRSPQKRRKSKHLRITLGIIDNGCPSLCVFGLAPFPHVSIQLLNTLFRMARPHLGLPCLKLISVAELPRKSKISHLGPEKGRESTQSKCYRIMSLVVLMIFAIYGPRVSAGRVG